MGRKTQNVKHLAKSTLCIYGLRAGQVVGKALCSGAQLRCGHISKSKPASPLSLEASQGWQPRGGQVCHRAEVVSAILEGSGSAQLCCLLCLNIQRQTAPVWATRTTHKAGCVLISAQCWALQGVWQREPKVPQKQPGRIRWKMPAPARCLPEGMHRNCPPCFCMLLYKTCFVCAFFVCLFLLGLFDMQLPKSLWQYPWKKKVIGIMSPFKLALVAEVRWATLLCALNEMKGNRVESDNSNNSVFPFSPSLWKGLQDPVCSSGSPELLPNFSAFCLKLRRETIAQPSRLLIAIFPELTLIQFCISVACYWVQASVTVVLSPPGLCPPCSGFLPWIIKTHSPTVLPRSSKG